MEQFLTGTVIRIDKNTCCVHTDGKTYRCPIRGRLKDVKIRTNKVVTVGDQVEFLSLNNEEGVIEDVFTQKTKLSRATSKNVEQVVVANVDQVLIVTSVAMPPFKTGLVDRMIVAACRGGLTPLICINKADLPEIEKPEIKEAIQIYRGIGYKVFVTSLKTQQGLDELRESLKDHKTVLAGHSGVGKSSLLSSIIPNLNLKTLEVSRKTQKGRHATTSVSMIPLPMGGYVVDTPGIRVFTLWKIEPEELSLHYIEMTDLRKGCKYPSCTHTHEPSCAVKDALVQGRFSSLRYRNYIRILETIQGKGRGDFEE